MEVRINQIPLEQKVSQLLDIYADCLRDEFVDVLWNGTVTLYVKQPESRKNGIYVEFFYEIYHETASGEMLEEIISVSFDPIVQKVLNRASSEYRESCRYPNHSNRIKFMGEPIVEIIKPQDLIAKSPEHMENDQSDFYVAAKFNVKKNGLNYKITEEMRTGFKVLVSKEVVESVIEILTGS